MENQKVRVSFLKSTILGGALFLVPLVVLAYVIFTALGYMRMIAKPIVSLLPWSGVGAVVLADLLAITGLVLFCFAAGYLARVGMARWFVDHMEKNFLMRLPGYAMFRGFAKAFDEEAESQRVVLVQFDDQAQLAVEVEQLEGSQRTVVYIPGSPEFNSGSLAVVEQSRVEVTNMNLLELRQIMHRYGQKFSAGLSKGS
ncbi:MAG TPA: DUF502 domain-containing protein [Xanthomonadales bacterium]|nr:DUF502 domain-containing protein [Xanthomonadales bacterium]